MERARVVCLAIALSGILSLMYSRLLTDQSLQLPRALHSDATITSGQEHDNTNAPTGTEELQEIDTGIGPSLKSERSTSSSSSSYHGNGVLQSGVDRGALARPKNGLAEIGHQVASSKIRSLKFQDEPLDQRTTVPRRANSDVGKNKEEMKEESFKRNKDEKQMKFLSHMNKSNIQTPLPENDAVLPAHLIKSIREQLSEMRDKFKKKSALVFDRAHLPRNLTLLGKAIFRVVPEKFLPEYRSPCFHLHEKDKSSQLACLPHVFLAGFPKCATTDLFKKLICHHQIVATSKEPHWWTRTRFTRESVLHYLGHQTNLVQRMEETGDKRLITMDASASTMWDNTYSLGKFGSIRHPPKWTHTDVLRSVLPDARFLLLLREPTDRLYSGYMAFDTEWRTQKSPEDFHQRLVRSIQDFGGCMKNYQLSTCVNFKYDMRLRVGMYSVFIRDWLKRYPREQLHVLRTEDWSKDPAKELSRIVSFLDLDPLSRDALLNITSSSRENQRTQKDRSLGGLLPESRRLLEKLYKPFKEDLAQLLQDDKYLWNG
ncbi:carbohydrate sulfotransferase 15-like [Lytechinus variegatus]|uniref:carbohydrate sulfotransferase 15-like n=1 Tax=Lytechinus variegatus TaxID=7654 RepID=UPI001BB2CEA9|nr:carbohydrate sulfotransferase 15-like [Lytechinus variegatus]